MYGKRPGLAKKLAHVKLIDSTPQEQKILANILNKIPPLGAFQFLVTGEDIELLDLGKVIEELKELVENSK